MSMKDKQIFHIVPFLLFDFSYVIKYLSYFPFSFFSLSLSLKGIAYSQQTRLAAYPISCFFSIIL